MENQKIELHRVVVTAIIVKDGKFLIARRGLHKRVQPGMWGVPGGGMELDDYLNTPKTLGDCWYFAIEKTLKREVMEEVGVEITNNIRLIANNTFYHTKGHFVLAIVFLCQYKSGTSQALEDTINVAWISPQELDNYQFPPNVKDYIAKGFAILPFMSGNKNKSGKRK